MSFISGAFTATYDGNPIGQVQSGFTVEWFLNKQLITGDVAALSPQDAVNLGAEVFVEFTLMEWDTASLKVLFWPFTTFGDHDVIGTLDSSRWKSLALDAVAGTPADITAEDLWTFPQAILAEGFPIRILMSPELKVVPVRLRVYPDSSGVFFTVA